MMSVTMRRWLEQTPWIPSPKALELNRVDFHKGRYEGARVESAAVGWPTIDAFCPPFILKPVAQPWLKGPLYRGITVFYNNATAFCATPCTRQTDVLLLHRSDVPSSPPPKKKNFARRSRRRLLFPHRHDDSSCDTSLKSAEHDEHPPSAEHITER